MFILRIATVREWRIWKHRFMMINLIVRLNTRWQRRDEEDFGSVDMVRMEELHMDVVAVILAVIKIQLNYSVIAPGE